MRATAVRVEYVRRPCGCLYAEAVGYEPSLRERCPAHVPTLPPPCFHDDGEWVRVGRCIQEKRCGRCGTVLATADSSD